MRFYETTTANQISVLCSVNELRAFEMSYELAVSVSEYEGFNTVRFDDNSVVSIVVSDDHEITILER